MRWYRYGSITLKQLASLVLRYLWVFVLVIVIYAPALLGTFIWDDEQFIYKNLNIVRFDVLNIFSHNTVGGAGVVSGYYRPFTSLTFAVDWLLSQGYPGWFHAVSVFWHLASGVMLAGLLSVLGLPILLPLIVFLLHPVQTEAVAYISGRGDPLSMFFGFLSMWGFVRYMKNKTSRCFLCISLIAFGLAVLSKESAVVFVVLLVMILVWLRMNNWFGIMGFAAITLMGIAMRVVVVGANVGFVWDGVYGSSLWIRFLTFSRVLFEYIRLIALPYPLHMERFVPLVVSLWSPWPWIALGIVLLIIMIGVKVDAKYKRQYWFGVVWFGLFLIPGSGILIPAPAIMTEHWLYGSLPGLGLSIDAFSRSWGAIRLKIVGVAIICLWVALGMRQSYIWAEPIRFYEYTLGFTQTARLHNNLGMHYAENGRTKEAEEQYLKAAALGEYPQIYINLGNLYTTTGRESQAVEQYRKAREMQTLR